MYSKKKRRPKLERCNAQRHVVFDAASLSSSIDDSSYSSSMRTRSLELYERKSFRVEGEEGEIDRICWSLGLSGPEDLGISSAAWEANKIRSFSDILPRSKYQWSDSTRKRDGRQNEEEHVQVPESELCNKVSTCVRIRDDDGNELARAESIESSAHHDIGVVRRSVTIGIKGARPPLLKPPPSMIIDNACSAWVLLRNFAPESDSGSLVIVDRGLNSSALDREEEQREANVEADNEEEEEQEQEEDEKSILRNDVTALLSESCSSCNSNDDDSSSTTTEPMSNISPNGKLMRTIISWEKGHLLGRGSFGSVYEGLSK